MNQETKRRKYGENYALYLRNYQRARSRVLTRLAQENPDRYKELLEEERAKMKRNLVYLKTALGATWVPVEEAEEGEVNERA